MKKIISTMLLLAFVGFHGVTSAAVAAEVCDKGYVSVSTEAEEEYAPNTAKITLTVQTFDKDLTKATEKNKELSKKSIDAVKSLLDETKGEKVKTSSFNVSPEYNYKNNVKVFVQYSAINSYEVTLKDTSKLGKVISTGLDNGANTISGLVYSLDTNEANCNALIQKATGTAKARAAATAQALGTSVAGIKSISAQCTSDGGYRPYYRMSAKAENMAGGVVADSSEAVPTEEGTIKLRAVVSADFYIK